MAPQAAGVIHGDFERGFIKAEVSAHSDWVRVRVRLRLRLRVRVRVRLRLRLRVRVRLRLRRRRHQGGGVRPLRLG